MLSKLSLALVGSGLVWLFAVTDGNPIIPVVKAILWVHGEVA